MESNSTELVTLQIDTDVLAQLCESIINTILRQHLENDVEREEMLEQLQYEEELRVRFLRALQTILRPIQALPDHQLLAAMEMQAEEYAVAWTVIDEYIAVHP